MKLSLAKRPLAIAAALLLAGAAQATVIHYGAALAGSNEVPPNASPGTGLAIVDYLTASHMLHLQLSARALPLPQYLLPYPLHSRIPQKLHSRHPMVRSLHVSR